MTQNDLYLAISSIDDDILERSERSAPNNRMTIRRIPAALIAAMLALLLMGAAAVAVIYGDSIQNWFGHYWAQVTGNEMTNQQRDLIDHLTQEIKMQQTIGDVTVTVDSATMGDDVFFLLIRVEGVDASTKHSYGFDKFDLQIEPDPVDATNGLGGAGFKYLWLDGDGAVLILIDYAYAGAEMIEWDSSPWTVTLRLTDFMQNPNVSEKKLLQEGEWLFEFELDRSVKPEILHLNDTKVALYNAETQKEELVQLTNIELTNTGLRFRFEEDSDSLMITSQIHVFLKNGAEIGHNGGYGVPLEGSNIMNYTFQWQVPINLEEVAGIKFGNSWIGLE